MCVCTCVCIFACPSLHSPPLQSTPLLSLSSQSDTHVHLSHRDPALFCISHGHSPPALALPSHHSSLISQNAPTSSSRLRPSIDPPLLAAWVQLQAMPGSDVDRISSLSFTLSHFSRAKRGLSPLNPLAQPALCTQSIRDRCVHPWTAADAWSAVPCSMRKWPDVVFLLRLGFAGVGDVDELSVLHHHH